MTTTYRLDDFVEPAWVIDCSRCAITGTAYETTAAGAVASFAAHGWVIRLDRPGVLCPQCAPGGSP